MDLTRADLTNADLTDADLTAAILRRADLTGADLTRATLDDADLTGAIFTRAVLAGALLAGATWSAETVWPNTETGGLLAAASTALGGGTHRVQDLTVPALSRWARAGCPEPQAQARSCARD